MRPPDSALEPSVPGPANDWVVQYTVDDYFLDRAIDLAWLGAGSAHPNPLVGALVVKSGRIVSVGYHQKYGEAHAETIALDRAGEAARGSTLYVTLEPCAHQGNTPPCVHEVVKRGVKRVVIPTLDPDERVYGRGVEILRNEGVDVDVGRRFERAMLLNMPYFKRVLGLGMTVTLKMAVTLDGRIASRVGSRDQISGEEACRFVHRLRAVHDAVLVGINTVLVDSPCLDCRLIGGTNPPAAVVLDSTLKFPKESALLKGARSVVVLTGESADRTRENDLVRAGARITRCAMRDGRVDVRAAMERLESTGVSSCLVEGGAEVFSSFAGSGCWDGLYMFVSPFLFGPPGVGLSSVGLGRPELGAVHAGVWANAGDVWMSYIRRETRRVLADRLL